MVFHGFIHFQYGGSRQKSNPIEREIMERQYEKQTVNLERKTFRIRTMTIPKIKRQEADGEVEYSEVTNSLRLVFSLAIPLAVTSVYFVAISAAKI